MSMNMLLFLSPQRDVPMFGKFPCLDPKVQLRADNYKVVKFRTSRTSPLLYSSALKIVDGRSWKRNRGLNPRLNSSSDSNSSHASDADSGRNAEAGEYEVFLSFRGRARKGFVDCLYHSLIDVGVRTFRDREEVHEGEKIGGKLIRAINCSKIGIPILTKDFADSAWCLRELAQMVECSRSNRLEILPIFYDVEPAEVKLYKGMYADALRQHGLRFDQMTLQQWEDALKQVARIKGWELEKATEGHEGELIKLVIRKVLIVLKEHLLNVTDQLVAMDDHVAKLMRMLNVGADDVRIVGIYGMGGIGKTTLAKVVFNHLSNQFEYCSFLKDVRETSQSRGLEFLQNQLISLILENKSPEVTNVDEGINMIRKRFSNKKVLILLDDVDKRFQLDALVGKRSWFGPGSRIIVTTRDKDVLNTPEVDWPYELTWMDSDQSLQLFSRHAFRRDYPPDDYVDYSKKAADITGGLPLALEILGSFLSGKSKKVWDSTLKKHEQVPCEEVEKKLRISYEALDHWQKQIFLDIACLFIGYDKRIVVHMWDDIGFFPEEGIEVLMLMSMIKIGDNNKLWMHDQLRDLGRQIVQQENIMEPGRRSRLWNHEESLAMLMRKKGSEMVQALCLKFDARCASFTHKEFASLSNLRFLHAKGVNLAGNFAGLFTQLRWLGWLYCPSNSIPNNFYLRSLVILDLSWSKISEDWEGWQSMKMATNLKVLNLTGCTSLSRHPDFAAYMALERLILEGCENLVEIDRSVESLKRLMSLNIRQCSSIQVLPEKLGSNDALRELLIDGTSIQEISFLPGYLKKLEMLSARNCKCLVQIRGSISHLESLSDLALDNTKIKHLPESIGKLGKLKRLSLRGCRSISKLPDTIGDLESLIELDLSSTGIKELPDTIKNLKSLKVLKVEHSFIEQIPPSIGLLKNLEELHAKGCNLEGEIPNDIGKLLYLRILSLSNNRLCSLPETISSLSRLQNLDLELCKKLRSLPRLPESLVILRVNFQSMVAIPDLSNLINLKQLYLSDGPHPGFPTNDLSKVVQDPCPWWIGMLPKLETLQLSLSKVAALPSALSELSRLRKLVLSCVDLKCRLQLPSSLSTLYISNCKSMTTLSSLSNLKSLTELDLLHSAISEVQDLEGLESLQVFNVIYCKLRKLDGLEKLGSLRRLILRNCDSLEQLPNLSNLKKLKEFKLWDCELLWEIQGLDGLESLEGLQISKCGTLAKLPDLSELKMLRSLEIKDCYKICEIEGLDRLELLEELQISECWSLEKLPDLSGLKKLKVLEIKRCEKVSDIPGLAELESLENLRIIRCKSIEKLVDVSSFRRLKSLYIEECEKVRHIVGLGCDAPSQFTILISSSSITVIKKGTYVEPFNEIPSDQIPDNEY